MTARQIIQGIQTRILQAALAAALVILPTQAQAVVGVGVTGKVGTTGLGADLTVPIIGNWINFRAGYNFGSLKPSTTQGDIDYKADIHFESDLSSTVGAGTVIGNTPVGTTTSLNANVSWSDDFAPYLGIGWGNAAEVSEGDSFGIGFSLDVGAFYQGNPDVVITESSGTVSAADLAAEAAQIEDDISDFKFFPVVTLGINIRF